MEYDVTIDRDKYIGGSDLPVILGISPFKTRYELLLEKAGLRESDFQGNRFTEYGNIMEPQIRDYINAQGLRGGSFEPNKVEHGDIRCHTDGFNGRCVLEIKTTSRIYDTLAEYKIYLAQLIKYMQENGVEEGLLAVYERPDDFNPVFNPENLHIYAVDAKEFEKLLAEVNYEIDRFRTDLARLKENPLLCEADFQPHELVVMASKALALEQRMTEFKNIEAQYKEMKQALYEAMERYGVKTWEMPNGTRVTRVDGTPATVETVSEFDTDRFKAENPEIFDQYQKTVTKKKSARAGYVKITP
jgi:putative phage-type endonuclease